MRLGSAAGWQFAGLRLAVLAWCLICPGCGGRLYEERLEESRKYFAYLEKLDTNLSARQKILPIEEVRVPLQFRPIPAPPPRKPVAKKDATETTEEPEPVDLRQPNYVNLKFPGMVAAWEAQLAAFIDGRVETKGGYIYAVSNAEMLSGNRVKEAPLFTRDLRRLLSASFGARLPDPDGYGETEIFPRAKLYSPQNTFSVTRLQPDAPIDGVPYVVEIYSLQNRDIQVALVVVMPRDTESSEKLNERIPLMLETFKISGQAPPRSAPGRAGGSSAGGSGGF